MRPPTGARTRLRKRLAAPNELKAQVAAAAHAQLRKPGELCAAGVQTEANFGTQKAELLRRIWLTDSHALVISRWLQRPRTLRTAACSAVRLAVPVGCVCATAAISARLTGRGVIRLTGGSPGDFGSLTGLR